MTNNLSHKILNAEIPPPESVWEQITAELDKVDHPSFVRKINNASVAPPATVWNKIANALNESRTAVIPLNRAWTKWTAAAVVAGLILFTGWLLFNNDKDQGGIKETETASSKSANSSIPGNPSTSNSNSPLSVDNNASATAGTKLAINERTDNKGRNGINRRKGLPIRATLVEPSGLEKLPASPTEGEPKISNNVSSTSANFISPPDYFVVTAPNGERVRISSKFSEAVTTLVGGDNIDYFWKLRFDSWKSKLMSNPSFIPTGGNFLDIAELKDMLKEQ